mgnify:CR=1 FL=1
MSAVDYILISYWNIFEALTTLKTLKQIKTLKYYKIKTNNKKRRNKTKVKSKLYQRRTVTMEYR